MSYTKVMYQRPTTTRDTISIRTTRPAPRKPKSSRSETLSKLKATYSQAARAFLHHKIEEANGLVEDAFELLHPPASQETDQLTTYRRKWDILRITLETTLYTTPVNGSTSSSMSHSFVNGSSSGAIPRSPNGSNSPRSKSPLDDPLLLSPPSLLGTLHTRSLKLFTPALERPNSRYLPAAVLVALVLASLKLDCPQVGRGMVDDWLANRDSLGIGSEVDIRKGTKSGEEREGYEKAVEVYCLHVLPRLNEWDYAKDFLDSEMEMRPSKREELIATLAAHHAQSLLPPSPSANQLQNLDNSVSGSSGAPTPRAASPAPSSVSSHTAVPNSRSAATLRASQVLPLSPSPTPTSRQWQPNRTSNQVPASLAIPPPAPALAPQSSSPAQPTILQVMKAMIIPYLRRVNAPVLLLAIVLSFIGLASRFGRRPKGGSGAEMARRRLAGNSRGLWGGLVDAVKMSGRGLV